MDDLAVDLQVVALLQQPAAPPPLSPQNGLAPLPPEKGATLAEDVRRTEKVVLNRRARGENFQGTFTPERDRRVLRAFGGAPAAEGLSTVKGLSRAVPEVEAIDFHFSNTGWFAGQKEVELVMVWEWVPPPPPENGPIPWLPMPPVAAPLPERKAKSLAARSKPEQPPDLRIALEACRGGGSLDAAGFAMVLARWLEKAAASCPQPAGKGGEGEGQAAASEHWLTEVSAELSTLQVLCSKGPPSPPPKADAGVEV